MTGTEKAARSTQLEKLSQPSIASKIIIRGGNTISNFPAACTFLKRSPKGLAEAKIKYKSRPKCGYYLSCAAAAPLTQPVSRSQGDLERE